MIQTSPQPSLMMLSNEASLYLYGQGKKCHEAGVYNVQASVHDFVAEGTGFEANSIDAALLFNILHHDEPVELMKEALRVLKPNGVLAIIHWNYDPSTPRGPAMEIRPRPEQCITWGRDAGFSFEQNRYELPPYHYGLLFRKPFHGGGQN